MTIWNSIQRQIESIKHSAKALEKRPEEHLQLRALELMYLVQSSTRVGKYATDCISLVVAAIRQTTGHWLHDVQILGGLRLCQDHIIEMKTGEGKTLVALLVTFFRALAGHGVHVITANDYLAKRDCELANLVLGRLGVQCGHIISESSTNERIQAYRLPVTYTTIKEAGFDFLRDRLAKSSTKLSQSDEGRKNVQRSMFCAVIDEVDSILIDEARTPLLIGLPGDIVTERKLVELKFAQERVRAFEIGIDYNYDPRTHDLKLTSKGRWRCRELLAKSDFAKFKVSDVFRIFENAIRANNYLLRGKQYLVQNDKVQIIDEFTGRIADGRQWQKGLHQAVEIKENVTMTPFNEQGATITIQAFVTHYRSFCGMSGTVIASRKEFARVYKKRVYPIPTNSKSQRIELEPQVFATTESKFRGIRDEVNRIVKSERAVLVGTRTVSQSLELSRLLLESGIEHVILNAENVSAEAEIVKMAGTKKRVTIATNMAGRGTDIKLDPDVCRLGGLHVILSELHESSRIDWQLIGRGARQGDPGSFRIFMSLDDDVLVRAFGSQKVIELKRTIERTKKSPGRYIKMFFKAQAIIEMKQMLERKIICERAKALKDLFYDLDLDPYVDAVT